MPYADREKRNAWYRDYTRLGGRRAGIEARQALLAVWKSYPCLDCGVSYPPPVMEFDHVRGEKLFQIGSGISTRSITSLRDEIAKCELVCANCHRLRHMETT